MEQINTTGRIRTFFSALGAVIAFSFAGLACADGTEKTEAAVASEVSPEVLQLTATFNDEAIPFHDKLITLGRRRILIQFGRRRPHDRKINRHALKTAVLVRQLLAQNGVIGIAATKS